MPFRPAKFFARFVAEFLEAQLENGTIRVNEYNDLIGSLHGNPKYLAAADRLFQRSPRKVHVPGYGPLRIVYLHELTGRKFPFLQGLSKPPIGARKLTCFVGHRFLPEITTKLRHNLAQLLGPYDIQLRWSGYDLSAAGLLTDIVDGIRNADMCFFDNLGTLNRPNVYIEIGIAHAIGKPMIVSEYAGPSRPGGAEMPETGSVPSDLQSLLRIQYASYEDLFKKLYFGLPIFFERNRFERGA